MVGGRTAAVGPLTPRPGDPGLYGPGSEAWRLNREAALLLGAGPRALLLQLAHPLVAEGVDQHSDFRADPWARLAGTLRSYLRIVYGTRAAALAEVARLDRMHGFVTGPVRDPWLRAEFGSTYEARKPELLLWVHATLVDSTLVTVDRWLEPLSPARRARIYDETLVVGRAFGIPDTLLPPHVGAFDAYMASMIGSGGPVRPTPVARSLAATILRPPLAPAVTRGPVAERLGAAAAPLGSALERVPSWAVSWLLVPSIGLLPVRVREGYGFAWGPRERLLEAWLVGAWRAWRPIVPARWRSFPPALAADARMRDRG